MFVGQAVCEQCLDSPLVVFFALALEVGANLAFTGASCVAANRALIPIEPEPAQAIQDDIDRLLCIARGVGIFNAQDECSARVPGIQPVEQCSPGPANGQKP